MGKLIAACLIITLFALINAAIVVSIVLYVKERNARMDVVREMLLHKYTSTDLEDDLK